MKLAFIQRLLAAMLLFGSLCFINACEKDDKNKSDTIVFHSVFKMG